MELGKSQEEEFFIFSHLISFHLIFFVEIFSLGSLESLESSECMIFLKKYFKIIVL